MLELSFIVVLLILLVTSRLAGEIMERFGQPPMVGEILVGIILGPSVLMVIDPDIEWLKILANIGLFFMVFLAGVEMRFKHVRENYRSAVIIALSSFILSFGSGFLLGTAFQWGITASLITGLVFSLSALPIAVRIFMDFNKLDTRVGRLTIVSAVIDDILAMIFLSIVISMAKQASTGKPASFASIAYSIAVVFVFILIIYMIERILAMKFGKPSLYIKHYIRKFRSKEAQFTGTCIASERQPQCLI